jgi:hypothetical protein
VQAFIDRTAAPQSPIVQAGSYSVILVFSSLLLVPLRAPTPLPAEEEGGGGGLGEPLQLASSTAISSSSSGSGRGSAKDLSSSSSSQLSQQQQQQQLVASPATAEGKRSLIAQATRDDWCGKRLFCAFLCRE